MNIENTYVKEGLLRRSSSEYPPALSVSVAITNPKKSGYVESNRESRDGVEFSVKNRDIPIKSGSVAGLL